MQYRCLRHLGLSLPGSVLSALGTLLLFSTSVHAANMAPSAKPGAKTLCEIIDSKKNPAILTKLDQARLRIGTIQIDRGPIFNETDPAESGVLYHWANVLHFLTRDSTIRKDLLFTTGSPFSAQILSESERLLRSRRYIWDATIVPIRRCEDRVDVRVTTRDVWTLTPSASFGRSGGANKFSFSLNDTSLLGYGKAVSLSRFSNVDRTGSIVTYQDQNFLNQHAELDIDYANNSDGKLRKIVLQRPFFALNTRWAGGGELFDNILTEQLYFRSAVVEKFQHRRRFVRLFGGVSDGLQQGETYRTTFGIDFDQNDFSQLPGEPLSFRTPLGRKLLMPWWGLSYVQDRYVTLENLRQINRTEDLNLGLQFSTRLGFTRKGLGSDKTRVVVETSLQTALNADLSNLLLLSTDFRANFLSGGGTESQHFNLNLDYFHPQNTARGFFASVQLSAVENLYPEEQLTLGGDSGLRGYPLRYQAGDRRILATVEQRFFTHYEIWRLFDVGAAAFADVGRAWFRNGNNGRVDGGVLADVGIGLRFSSTRAGHNKVIHMDLAFPLGAQGNVSAWQWSLKLKSSF